MKFSRETQKEMESVMVQVRAWNDVLFKLDEIDDIIGKIGYSTVEDLMRDWLSSEESIGQFVTNKIQETIEKRKEKNQ